MIFKSNKMSSITSTYFNINSSIQIQFSLHTAVWQHTALQKNPEMRKMLAHGGGGRVSGGGGGVSCEGRVRGQLDNEVLRGERESGISMLESQYAGSHPTNTSSLCWPANTAFSLLSVWRRWEPCQQVVMMTPHHTTTLHTQAGPETPTLTELQLHQEGLSGVQC